LKALIYNKFGGPDVLEWTDNWPDPAASPSGVLVRAAAGGLNPKDALLRKGKFSRTLARDPLPRASGMEVAGDVIAVGQDVSGFSVGDVVFGMTNRFSGGLHAEMAALEENEITLVPTNVSTAAASAVPLAAQTALQALRDCCRIEAGQKLLINGASGGVGHFAVQIAKVLGAEAHAVCGARNADFVRSLGADAVYDYNAKPAPEVDGRFDCVFDVFGRFTRADFKRQLGRGGIFVSTVPKFSTIGAELLARIGAAKSSRLVGVRSDAADLRRIAQWMADGRVTPHVEAVYPVTRAADAHRHIESKHTVGKVVISFQEQGTAK